jgi:hypothetical protein
LCFCTGGTVGGDRIPVGARFSALVQTSPWARPASYTMGTGSFPGVKRPGRGVDHQPHLASRLKKEYSYTSTCTPRLGLRGLFWFEIYLLSLLVTLCVSGWLSRYSDYSKGWTVRDRIPVTATFSAPFQTDPGSHPASCTMCTGSFPGVKRPGRGVDHPPPSSAEVKERVGLYLYSSSSTS